jgi:hypothetical protein
MGRPRRRRRGSSAFTGPPDGLQPGDDVGNRHSRKQQKIPPDDIGNRKESEAKSALPPDDVGNRIDAAPTHESSGVLADIDGRRRRRKKGSQPMRIGRYVMGGVNPIVSGNTERAIEALKEEEQRRDEARGQRNGAERNGEDFSGEEGGEGSRSSRRRRRRRRNEREQVDGVAAQEVSERRAQRFFDFEEDDRFDYVLKTDPESKRADAQEAVRSVLENAGRAGEVIAKLLEDEDRPKVLVTIDESGPADSLDAERKSDNAGEPLFVLGNAALMSLNYLVNKIVNRYPDDRIRLAILPKADEGLYMRSLEEHISKRGKAAATPSNGTPKNGASAGTVAEPAEAVTTPPETVGEAEPDDTEVDAAPVEDEAAAPKKKAAPSGAKKAKVTRKKVEAEASDEAEAKPAKKATKKAVAKKSSTSSGAVSKTAKTAKTAKTSKTAKAAKATKKTTVKKKTTTKKSATTSGTAKKTAGE